MVTIYSTAWCAFCKTEKQWLDSLGVAYESKMIDEDEAAMKEFEALNVGSGVPVTVIGDTIVRGFDRPALKNAIGI